MYDAFEFLKWLFGFLIELSVAGLKIFQETIKLCRRAGELDQLCYLFCHISWDPFLFNQFLLNLIYAGFIKLVNDRACSLNLLTNNATVV